MTRKESPKADPIWLKPLAIVILWLMTAFVTWLILELVFCQFLVELVGMYWAPEALVTPELDGPPLLQLFELLCGPLWWLLPTITATAATARGHQRLADLFVGGS